jgi:hypothetical protein
MTTKKHLKRRVRSRVAQTGEPYATALRMVRQQQENRMPSTTTPADPTTPDGDVIASCSFCGKPSTEVQRLVAGPGVYICNECVELSAAIIDDAGRATAEESSRRRSQHVDLTTDEMLTMVPALVRSLDRVERELAAWVNRLRQREVDWPTIASACGLTADEARRRFESAAER